MLIQQMEVTVKQSEEILVMHENLQENKAFRHAVEKSRHVILSKYSNLNNVWNQPEFWDIGYQVSVYLSVNRSFIHNLTCMFFNCAQRL